MADWKLYEELISEIPSDLKAEHIVVGNAFAVGRKVALRWEEKDPNAERKAHCFIRSSAVALQEYGLCFFCALKTQ